ncbi:MerR family transcriptional regulator [Clostridium botulinum]|uniref:MerR family transcriptional regulator n=1 Tax=Clostridium botulinum TaxID=1491 RepID=UPI0004D41B27|nr:MerR family transcriptional regulator [Clostridium botulinum]KEH96969.1 MerR family transcriptional regulator [Clostridium botulinum D str. 16868]KOA78128.1 MerR family transcriptional regulator [Clostridium botulinum]MCD3276151.1 MerR family transcriptional regulator [Clostridium botulinum C/D]MCD3287951.1 MerR family transcriptional regulator [Clostridium botulinum C/D]MCD3290055.1 MerR family transcriptional regulator [Clostridium botulinum C/D]
MKTVKQVSDLTGISVRMLHYYDKIGLLKPSKFTDSGYRLYDDEALETLQQILFFKELDIPLKEVKEIMGSPYFDKMQALEEQKKLLIIKRDRLNNLIELINKTLKGENEMSFKEFHMTEYFNMLDEFKTEHQDKVIKTYGSMDKYNECIEKMKACEAKLAKIAIKQYGSVKKYVEAVKKNLNNSIVITKAEQIDKFKKDCLYDKHPKLKELYKKLTGDLSKDPSSKEIQQIAGEITNIAKKDYEVFKTKMGDDYWYYMVKNYSVFPDWIEKVDNKYGIGASKFIGKALKVYLGDKKPKISTLYEKLTADLSKNTSSKEIQEIVSQIVYETQKQNEILKVDVGENYWNYIAEQYLSESTLIKVNDKEYGNGASNFIGKSLKFYCENKISK